MTDHHRDGAPTAAPAAGRGDAPQRAHAEDAFAD